MAAKHAGEANTAAARSAALSAAQSYNLVRCFLYVEGCTLSRMQCSLCLLRVEQSVNMLRCHMAGS